MLESLPNRFEEAKQSFKSFSDINKACDENIKSIQEAAYAAKNPVIEAYETIKAAVIRFHNIIGDDYEIGIQFYSSQIMRVTVIDYSLPTIINFHGNIEGKRAHMLQHINNLNFLLIAIPKEEPEKPARRIGFEAEI